MYETNRLILKKPRFSDWEAMYRNVWRHEETARYMLWDVTRSEEDAQERMRRSISFQQTHSAWFIYEKATDTPIGFVGFCDLGDGVFEDTGLALGPDYVRKGYGTEILNLLLDIIAQEYNGRRFIATCRSENIASRGLILRCGFRFSHTEDRSDPRDGSPYILEFYEKDLI